MHPRSLLPLALVAGCGSRPPAPQPPPADIHAAWLDAVEARSPERIAALIQVPARVLFDDVGNGRADCAPWRGGVHEVVTLQQRGLLASCIAATVTHSRLVDSMQATGEVAFSIVAAVVEPRVLAMFEPLARDHRFVRGQSMGAGEYDFVLAVANGTGAVDAIALTVLHDEGPAGFGDESDAVP